MPTSSLPARTSPVILALDTATEFCSVALLRNDVPVERVLRVEQQHSEHLLPMLRALLDDTGLALNDCDAIAFGAGPGSFTGLRIACGVAQGLAYACDKPVIAISNLTALARAAAAGQGRQRVLAAIDARMQEMYWSVVDVDGDDCTELIAPSLGKPAELAALVQQHGVDLLSGNALSAFAAQIPPLSVPQRAEVMADAAQIACLGRNAFKRGALLAPADAAPLYVRNQVAQTVQERELAKLVKAQAGGMAV